MNVFNLIKNMCCMLFKNALKRWIMGVCEKTNKYSVSFVSTISQNFCNSLKMFGLFFLKVEHNL